MEHAIAASLRPGHGRGVLITGAGGQLGTALAETFPEAAALTRREWDVRLPYPGRAPTCDLVLHAAAWTDVDGAEDDPGAAAEVNVGGTQHAAELGAPIVAFSTDYVFDGSKREPYVESDGPNPLGAYGRTKLVGEAAAGERAWVVRSSWLFGPTGRNFVRTMLRLGAERDEVAVVDDQRGSPTYVGHLAAAVPAIVELPFGVVHVAAAGDCTWADFAEAIFAEAGLDCRVRRITAAEFGAKATRPAYSVLRSERGAPELPALARRPARLPRADPPLSRRVRRRPRLAVLREREFRLLYAGQTISLLGDGMLIVALSFAVLDLTGSVSDLGFVVAASRAPLVLTVLAGGVVADRVSRRAVMVVADLVRMAALGVSAALLVAGDAQIWQLAALQVLVGTASGFFYPAATGLLPLTVRAEMLQQANGLRGLSEAAGKVLGPALGGVLVVGVGPGWAIAVDAASFGVSAVTLALLHLAPHVRELRQRFTRDLADGWREFRSRTWVWTMVVVAGAFGNLFMAFMLVLGPQIASDDLGGAGAWAAILAVEGVGGLVGGLVVIGLRARRRLVAAVLAWSVLAIPNALLALVAPLPVIAAGALVGGAGLAVGQALWDTTLQRHIPAASLSRVSSYDWFGSLLFNPIGLALAGPIAAAIGTPAALGLAAGWFVLSSAFLVALPPIRAVRESV